MNGKQTSELMMIVLTTVGICVQSVHSIAVAIHPGNARMHYDMLMKIAHFNVKEQVRMGSTKESADKTDTTEHSAASRRGLLKQQGYFFHTVLKNIYNNYCLFL